MAFTMSYEKEAFGQILSFPAAYFEIVYLSGTKEMITVQLNAYDNKNKENLIDQFSFSFTPDTSSNAKDIFAQGYSYIKTLPNFSGAIDTTDGEQTV